MPALTYHFRLRWKHVKKMPEFELREYLAALDELAEANERTSPGGE